MRFAGWVYEDASIQRLERELLFQGAWAVVGHEAQIPRPGEFLTTDVGVERVLVIRDPSGTVRALRNSCPASPHTLIALRSGRLDAPIECQLHGLGFSWEGRGGSAGDPDLGVLDLCSVGGLMFARSRGLERAPEVPSAPRTWLEAAPLGLTVLHAPREVAVAADWKVLVEQWLESSSPYERLSSAEDCWVWHVPAPSESHLSGRAYLRLVDSLAPRTWRRQFIAPNQLLETRPDGLSVMQVLPVAAGRCSLRRLDYSVLALEDSARAALFLAQRLAPYARRALLDCAESIQRGMIDFGYQSAAGGTTAPAVAWFRRRLAARIPALARAVS